PVEVEKVCSQVDILPTLLNLLGAEYDSRMLAGIDVLSDQEGMAVFFSRSWITDQGTYSRYTEEFQPAPDVEMTEEEKNVYVENKKYLADCRLRLGELIIETDYYRKALP
ncbi:MAG TPA: LTA synthase family protein, partial [Lachnoclostridium phocaeense]|nr:LTA synthase family protein [Lachnoclostridium phocaeense]